MYCQNDSFWNKIEECSATCQDIERYLYSQEYLSLKNPTEYVNIKNIYNTNLFKYHFDVEKYTNEADYREIYFQGFLDGEINEKEYYSAEKSFSNLINCLSYKDNVYVYFDFFVSTENNYPFQKSNDVNFDINFIKDNQGKLIKIVDKSQLEQISILFAREIVSGYIIFNDIKSVLTCSGMHGYILSVNDLNSNLLNNISLHVSIEKI